MHVSEMLTDAEPSYTVNMGMIQNGFRDMAVASTFSTKPVMIGLKHAGLSMVTLCLAVGLGGGVIQAFGNPDDAGPRAVVEVPKPAPPTSENHAEAHKAQGQAGAATGDAPVGSPGFFPWRLPDGAMTPWAPGTPPPAAPMGPTTLDESQAAQVAALDKAKGPPVITSPAAAASADAMPPVSGEARIMASQFGAGSSEGGVRVMRGNRPPPAAALTAAPAAGVHQPGPGGLLPVIGAGGRTVFDVYKKPFSDSGKPKVALVLGGLGFSAIITQRAIDELPAEVTLSFVPYADNLQGWINKARADGHEVMIEIPMEPFDFPENDPGPHTLLSTAPIDENQRRLDFLLARATGYFGVTNYLGGKFAGADAAAAGVLRNLKARGVAFIADGSANALETIAQNNGLRAAEADRVIDQRTSAEDVAAQLGALEAMATQKGSALGFGVAYAVTIDQIARWAREAGRRGIQLAPASAVTS
jgi:uncharacterized protein